jgi:signal transduction histidine kinase
VGAPWAAVWLQVEGEGRTMLRLTAATGDAAAVRRIQAEPAVFDVRPRVDGELVPLTAGDEIVGVLACGFRSGNESRGEEREILELVARQSALVLRNSRLEEELRQRLEELQDSRQRLVSAQDEERRKLERDLHDGVQQQLVALAANLRQASTGAAGGLGLGTLADEAEEAVFALQDLARGIYPGVLADRGLAEALRAHAVRVPLKVRVEVEPKLVSRRFEREVEAGLYFVALEAVTNAQKYAGPAAVTVSLRWQDDPPAVALEIHDDGLGFNSASSSSGSGLQNIADRVSALGGMVSIQSRPGAGTWIKASVPIDADIVPIQAPGTASRR